MKLLCDFFSGLLKMEESWLGHYLAGFEFIIAILLSRF